MKKKKKKKKKKKLKKKKFLKMVEVKFFYQWQYVQSSPQEKTVFPKSAKKFCNK